MLRDNEMEISLKNSLGLLVRAKLGFSWTMFLFGVFVPLIRGDTKWFFISLILAILTFGCSWFVLPFFYNKVYVRNLLLSGYTPIDTHSKEVLIENGIIYDSSKKVINISKQKNQNNMIILIICLFLTFILSVVYWNIRQNIAQKEVEAIITKLERQEEVETMLKGMVWGKEQ